MAPRGGSTRWCAHRQCHAAAAQAFADGHSKVCDQVQAVLAWLAAIDRFAAINPGQWMSMKGRYAELSIAAPMHRSQLCADRVSGRTISPMTMAHKARHLIRIVLGAMSIRVARRQRLLIPSSVRRPRSSRDCESTRNSRDARQTLALSRAERSRRRRRFDDYCRERQLAAEIAHCVARPPMCENYVEVRLPALGPEPRDFSITTLERSTSAHSCDLCIGVDGGYWLVRSPVVQVPCPIGSAGHALPSVTLLKDAGVSHNRGQTWSGRKTIGRVATALGATSRSVAGRGTRLRSGAARARAAQKPCRGRACPVLHRP